MKDAIIKAIEGGYGKDKGLDWDFIERNFDYTHRIVLTLDPLFWHAIGKAEGWTEARIFDPGDITDRLMEAWKYHMHRFIDHIIAGGTVDEFFNKILTK